jgi:nitrate/nitrite-specific signal transduction histidine kinase
MYENNKTGPCEGSKRIDDLLEYFEKGKAFTKELMKENERLRMSLLKVEKEKMDLAKEKNSSRIKYLEQENRSLRICLDGLEKKFNEVEKENQDFALRYVEVQGQNDNLLNLYVASYQLHSTLDPKEVIEVIVEIILNLIGAEEYIIVMMDKKNDNPVVVTGEGPQSLAANNTYIDIDPVLAKVLREGKEFFRTNEDNFGPLACTPLKVNNDIVGAISISKLMDQKRNGLTTIDHELLGLLSDHAATALVSSNIYSRTQRKLRTVEGFLELLKMDGTEN